MKVAIVGANGYSGIELIRLLLHHPFVDIELLVSGSSNGVMLQDLYPSLKTICHMQLEQFDYDEIDNRVDLVFFATPSGVSQKYIPKLIDKGVHCIDLSGDYRLKDQNAYKTWYKKDSADQKELDLAVYGLSEFNSQSIAGATLIANPGCFPTATLLGILPAIKMGYVNPHTVIVDGKTGVSGAGRSPSLGAHFSEVNENVKAYKVGMHQHIPEIEQGIKDVTGIDVNISFTSQLVPMTRGIMCTIYANLLESHPTEELILAYKSFYKSSQYVRVHEVDYYPTTKEVYGSNYCDIGMHIDPRTERLTIVSVIDNLVKGASGQAIQNMNIMYGWESDTGLKHIPIFP